MLCDEKIGFVACADIEKSIIPELFAESVIIINSIIEQYTICELYLDTFALCSDLFAVPDRVVEKVKVFGQRKAYARGCSSVDIDRRESTVHEPSLLHALLESFAESACDSSFYLLGERYDETVIHDEVRILLIEHYERSPMFITDMPKQVYSDKMPSGRYVDDIYRKALPFHNKTLGKTVHPKPYSFFLGGKDDCSSAERMFMKTCTIPQIKLLYEEYELILSIGILNSIRFYNTLLMALILGMYRSFMIFARRRVVENSTS